MFKRRDWVYTHNPDTGDVTSDSDTDGGSDVTSDEGTSDATSVGDEYDEPGQLSDGGADEQVGHPMRMEDLQEILGSDESDDAGGGVDTVAATAHTATAKVAVSRRLDATAVERQKAEWLQAPEGISMKGIPLRCLLCKGKLLVNSCGFQAHMKSKAHLAAAKRHGILDDPLAQLDNIVAAAACRHETEETETHRERVERFQQIAEKLKQRRQSQASEQPPNKHKNKKRKTRNRFPEEQLDGRTSGAPEELQTGSPAQTSKWQKSGRNRSDKPRRKKPGRRQRIEAKAAAAAAAK